MQILHSTLELREHFGNCEHSYMAIGLTLTCHMADFLYGSCCVSGLRLLTPNVATLPVWGLEVSFLAFLRSPESGPTGPQSAYDPLW